ncbi:MAG TPA: hypothetical protein VIY47_14855 [Ignavibacteriaceae bacterium]
MKNEYPELLVGTIPTCRFLEGHRNIMGDHGETIKFSPVQQFLTMMHLLTSSWEQGSPDFKFQDLPENVQKICKEWVQNPDIREKITKAYDSLKGTLTTDMENNMMFHVLRMLMFENHCLYKLSTEASIPLEKLDHALLAASEMFPSLKERLYSVLAFAVKELDSPKSQETNELELDDYVSP